MALRFIFCAVAHSHTVYAHVGRVQYSIQCAVHSNTFFQGMEFDFTHRLLCLELCFFILCVFFFHFCCWLVCLYVLEPTHSLCSRAIRRFLWKPSHPACQFASVCMCLCVCAWERERVKERVCPLSSAILSKFMRQYVGHLPYLW